MSNINSFNEYVSKQDHKLSKKFINDWLEKQEVHSMHKYIQPKQRSQFVSSEIDNMWGADLIDFRNLSKKNDGFNYILVIIDFLSKYLWVHPMKNKKPYSIIEGFKNIFDKGRICKILITDAGKEFENKYFKKFLSNNSVKLYIMRNEVKCAIAERVIRTLKEKLERHFFITGSKRYVDVLDIIVNNYNNTKHSRTKYKPVDINERNKVDAFLNLYRKRIPNRSSEFKVGDKIRIRKIKKNFEKGYSTKWSKEIFRIEQILSTLLAKRYIISDLIGEKIIGSFYDFELQQVNDE